MCSHETKKQDAITQVCDQLSEQLGKLDSQPRQSLARLYYDESIPKELLQCQQDDLLGAINCLWLNIYQRQNDEDKVAIYHPNYEEHEWESSHTIIDIVCTDRPFLVSSITNVLVALGHTIHMTTHPVLAIGRDKQGQITSIEAFSGGPNEPNLEAVMRFEIDHLIDPSDIDKARTAILAVLKDVRLVVDDWQAMCHTLVQLIEQLEQQKLPIEDDVKAENLAFLRWASNNHFTFMGYRYYGLEETAKHTRVVPQADSGLGTFRPDNSSPQHLQPSVLSDYLAALAKKPQMLVITKSTSRSTVHRAVNFDYLGVKQFNDQGEVVGEHRFFGLYASAAYVARVHEIPVLRHKTERIQQDIQVLPASHKGKALLHVLNSYPRDEMLQAPVEELLPIIRGILETQERNSLRLFMRFDIYGRFLTGLIYVPRERFHTQLRKQLQDILMQKFNGSSSEFSVSFAEQTMARVQITVHGQNMRDMTHDSEELELQMRDAMLSWQDHLLNTLQTKLGEAEGLQLWREYEQAFPLAYQENHTAKKALRDLLRLSRLSASNPLSTHLYQSLKGDANCLNFKVFGMGHAKALSDVLPILEYMGVKVISAQPYSVKPNSSSPLWMIDFAIQLDSHEGADIEAIKEGFQEAFAQAYSGRIASDRFNGLVLTAGINWREAELMRAISAYLHQIQVPFSRSYIQTTLNKNAHITRLLVSLFAARFDPQNHSEKTQIKITKDINKALDKVSNLNEDRIIKYFLITIEAVLRCNYYQTDSHGQPHNYLALKIDPQHIPGIPLPLPKFEIFMFSAWVEGVHLRGGKVARGGLRWSDRHEDYRTEVLGLVKAQMVKNAVIVPLGAKGGFVCKQLPEGGSREQVMAEVIRSYSTFIQSLIDLTDNIVDKLVVSPANTVRYDDDDPYLVVAADKGTATFSDIANSISEDNNFWLGDAFASGGANGYDHKKMGITARGAWESVKRLFAETGHDCQTQDFTAIGVGDMAGDVFGNGMLLSEHTCLRVAFNHLHIFIDPTPDAASSYAERQRLFKLSRSSWEDYNSKLISQGGGIFERSAKSIKLSPQMQAMLQTEVTQMPPNELIHELLKMPVDLFWNGGIGTYVKASNETHNDIGDPANDALRVNGCDLGARVVGEGGNLGCSQAGRIEFAKHGGLINTDAIDNSGGVDSSDHEVNIKILLSQVVENGDMTLKQRNKLLASMTDEVADLVLDHNYHQSLVLSVAHHTATANLYNHKRLIHNLEGLNRLNRALEGLPSDAQIDERMRQQEGLTRPEIAVLLAYSKMHLFDELMLAGIAEDTYLSQALSDYFPQPLQKQFAKPMGNHPLRAEIIATHVTNQIGNRMGATFFHLLQAETGAGAGDIARAFMAACHILGANSLWKQLDKVTLSLDYHTAMDLHGQIQALLEAMVQWLLQHHAGECINSMIDLYSDAVGSYAKGLIEWLPESAQTRLQTRQATYFASGMDQASSQHLAQLEFIYYGLDIASVASHHKHTVADAGNLWFALYDDFQGDWLSQAIAALPSTDAWQRKARSSLKHELEAALTSLTGRVLQCACLDDWKAQQNNALLRISSLFEELHASQDLDLAKLSVAVGEITRLQHNH